jgi:hypothetical protein
LRFLGMNNGGQEKGQKASEEVLDKIVSLLPN